MVLKTTLVAAALPLLAAARHTSGPSAATTPATVCDPSAHDPTLLAQQEAAIADFIHIFYEQKDPQAAFDKYIPGSVLFPFTATGTRTRSRAHVLVVEHE